MIADLNARASAKAWSIPLRKLACDKVGCVYEGPDGLRLTVGYSTLVILISRDVGSAATAARLISLMLDQYFPGSSRHANLFLTDEITRQPMASVASGQLRADLIQTAPGLTFAVRPAQR